MADAESKRWVEQLAHAATRDAAVARLHSFLLRICHSEANRRSASLPRQTLAELDDLCTQAANDAVLAVMRKLDSFRGLSRFTTWAGKFGILEISSRLRRHAWRARPILLAQPAWDLLPEPSLPVDEQLQQIEAAQRLKSLVDRELTDRQRLIFTAVTADDVPIDVLAEHLGSSRGAIYKTLHDARLKLQAALAAYHRVGVEQ